MGKCGLLTFVDIFLFLFFFSFSLFLLSFKKKSLCVGFISLFFLFLSISFSFLHFVAHWVLFGLSFCPLTLQLIHSCCFFFLSGIISFPYFSQVFFLSWSTAPDVIHPFNHPEYINFLKLILFMAHDSFSGFQQGYHTFLYSHKKYNRGSGRKRTNEQYGLRSALSERIVL